MESFDLVIVGAGWHGLAMAKTYHEVCPDHTMLVVDAAQSIGGTWAAERLYPGLKTNNIIGSYEFGDFPMTPEHFAVQAGQHIPGAVVHEYLCRFAKEFDLTSRIRLRTKVESAEMQEGGDWLLRVCTIGVGSRQISTLLARRLVVATGLTSEPHLPDYKGRESFTGNLLHSRQLKDRADDIRQSKEVVVVGANKSAWDTCYTAAMAGAHVSMVIRPGGGGPSWVWPVKLPFGLSLQKMATTRFFTMFDPCIWSENSGGFGWARRVLHRTWLGRQVVKWFWKMLAIPVLSANGYSTHPELAKLKPWSSMFWMGNSLGVHNYETNWFELVKQGKINIHIGDVTSLSGNKVLLSNGIVLVADTFVSCTGWKVAPPIEFLPESITAELGIPGLGGSEDTSLLEHAVEEISGAVPELQAGPVKTLPEGSAPITSTRDSKTSTPYRLYRFMVPPTLKYLELRNIAFIGAHLALNAIAVAQAQALWLTAFFEDGIPHLERSKFDVNDIQYRTILQSEYCRLRHPPAGGGAGERCPDLVFDGLLYTDLLLRDVGLETFRKRGRWQELFHRYLPKDYAGMSFDLATHLQRAHRAQNAGGAS
ncbi:hypothetical protein G647_04478 [Cladophialophora carrionii CBS 160.54]|uniref:Uncharacterized protein n=1 Tax=Cladophialophora carrionii CBS 160.54 TaxID=1279043 RepID=V9DGK8_9EURO|nr:uncharacterized protein G647_04478 [Cladophialophora carrionii CBS 160.54]ETI25107.1 hypothetical protein G647_04478 [Cladophialophora carrionii CBS 160.54]